MSAIICEKEGNRLVEPFNTWDMNYHFYSTDGKDYLIDVDDVQNSEEELDQYGGILWDDLKNLRDIEEIKGVAWKTSEVKDDSLQFWDILSKI